MLGYALRRLAGLIPVWACIIVLSFLVVRLAPGSPFSAERAVAPEVQATLAARYGLDQPLPVQLGRYMAGLLHADMGPSLKYPQREVTEIIAAGLPTTLALGASALAWALLLGVSLGLAGALHPGRSWDLLCSSVSLVGLAVPSFVLGPLLVELLCLRAGLLPTAGWGTPAHLVLPALTLGTVYAAPIARLTRAGVLEVAGADYVRTARAKGLRPWTIATRHVARGGLLPLVSYLGPAVAHLLVGSVVVEKIFNLPGIGPYFVDAAFNRDYFLVMGIVVLESSLLLVMNLLVDLAYAALDPRIRLTM
jgi:oligopeptide transport system permease protein